jgi:hypothetical protein
MSLNNKYDIEDVKDGGVVFVSSADDIRRKRIAEDLAVHIYCDIFNYCREEVKGHAYVLRWTIEKGPMHGHFCEDECE